jgi:uncharacterized surface anchored protein
MRASVSRARSRGTRAAWRASQALLILSMLIGLISPLFAAGPAAAAQPAGAFPPPLPAPARVSLSGTFQTALGCPADSDPTCPQTQLQDNHDGSWSAVLPVPPGDYTFRVVASSEADRSLGAGGDPNGADLSLSVPADAKGAYFSYDSLTGEIVAEPVNHEVTLATDLGEQFAMEPSRRGGYEVTWDAQPGNYGFQIQVDGQPAGQDSVSLDRQQRVIVDVDESGAVTNKDTLRDTRLDVSAVDASGAPRPDSCFAIVDRQNQLRTQACDQDDGQADGTVSLRVPNGLDDGNYSLLETFTANNGTPAPEQQVTLGGGHFQAEAQAAGQEAAQAATAEPTTETGVEQPASQPGQPVIQPGDRPGQLTVVPVDDAGQPIPGACFAIPEFSFEACDDDGDGTVIFDAVPATPITLRETTPPAGFAAAGDLPLTMEVTGERVLLPQQATGEAAQPAATETPAIEGQQTPQAQPVETPAAVPAGANQVVLTLRDRDGQPVPGACWALTSRDDNGTTQHCDGDDGSDDGTITFDAVSAGRYRLDETTTPDGFRPAESQNVEVVDGTPAQVTVEYRGSQEEQQQQQQQGQPGRLVIEVADQDGNPMPQTCFDLSGPTEMNNVCDKQNDGKLNIPDLPPGKYTVTQTQTAKGFTPAAATTIDVPAGDTVELPIVNAATGQAAVPENEGRVVVDVHQEDGSPVANACATLAESGSEQSVCDQTDQDESDVQGRIEIAAVAPGSYTLTIQPPEGFAAPAPTTIDVAAGQPTPVDIALTAGEAQQANGNLVIHAEDASGNPLPAACYTIEIPPGGQGFGPFCDEDGNGEVDVQGVSPGPISVIESTPPTDTAAAAQTSQDIDITAGQKAEVTFQHSPADEQQETAGTIAVHIVDAAGQPVSACVNVEGNGGSFNVCDNDDQDGDKKDGQVEVDNVSPGTYTISLTNLPQDIPAPAAQQVEVAAGESAKVELSLSSGPGTLVLFVEDENGQRLGGSCFTIEGDAQTLTDVCDKGDDGRLNVPDLPGGDYTVTQTRAAKNRQLAAAQQVTVQPGQTVEATLLNPKEQAEETPTATPPVAATATPAAEATATPAPDQTPTPTTTLPANGETGTVELQAFDDAGNPIGGQCYTLTGSAGSFGPFCDNGEGDSSTDPGVLRVEGLPTGTYEAALQPAAGVQPGVEEAQQTRQHRSVSVRRGDHPTRARFNVHAQQNRRGDLLIRVRDQDGNYLAGACFALTGDGDTAPSTEVCDNRNDDQNSSDGRILISGLRAGRYTLSETTAPNGYAATADQSVRIDGGDVQEVAITNQAQRQRSATLDVETIDQQGNLLPSACYTIMKGNNASDACDTNGDGITRFADIEAGSYVVRQTQPPTGGYATAGATATIVDAGQSATVTVTNKASAGSLLIRKTDDSAQPLAGSCFALTRDNRAVYTICDNDASDGNNAAGVILLGMVAPGDYTLRETQTPSGYLTAADQDITISPNQRSQATVVDTLAPPPPRRGDLRVFKIDGSGGALAGSCFALLNGNGLIVSSACDADDGADDGVVLLKGVAVGDYTLRETRRPSADYATTADLDVSVAENKTVDVQVQNQLLAGRILIRKSDPNGVPLANACFDLGEDSSSAACTDANGELAFDGLAPGVYTVAETQAPSGYVAVAAIDPVTVRPGSTATIDVVDQPQPPPPDSGSIQVVKFLCPAAPGGGGIDFVDSSDPDGGGLARTAGCDRGDAAFTLDGPTGPLQFRTGASGRYQATLPTGDYVLTESTSGASEQLSISVNTLTTIVALNYVEPEGAAPAAIDVVKYTCDPGFQGQTWQDFADGCLSNDTLTNNVAFRISGPISARHVTGDAGIGGATRFDGLTAGDYLLREETPAGSVAVYAFCGLDPKAPDGRSVGDTLTLRLAAGQDVTCHWFNVPEDLAGDTGAITVYKYACPVITPSASFDWYGRCDPQGQGVRFSLSIWDGAKFTPLTIAATDGDGILRLTRLQPGTYDLKEVDATWCHAESDSVDANGHVVVAAGKRASVWIFNCVGAKNPPNTGAGPMWSGTHGLAAISVNHLFGGVLLSVGEASRVGASRPTKEASSFVPRGDMVGLVNRSALVGTLGLLWPLLGLAVVRVRRRAASVR